MALYNLGGGTDYHCFSALGLACCVSLCMFRPGGNNDNLGCGFFALLAKLMSPSLLKIFSQILFDRYARAKFHVSLPCPILGF